MTSVMFFSYLKEWFDTFWSPTFWLPPNVNWEDIDPVKHPGYANSRDLFIPIPLAAFFLCIRFFFEKYWFAPVGVTLGIKNAKVTKAAPNPRLEAAYSSKKKLKHKELVALAKQVDWSERQVERWWRHRRAQDKPSTLVKFCESSWRWVYYTYSFVFGMLCLWDKPWLWNINECWYDYPYQELAPDCWWYYMSSLGFYWSLAVSQFFDIKRKDFWQMFVHHVATICLLSFSWICNLHRIGTLVLLVHDAADFLLEAAKMAKYANYQKLCDVLFVIFTLVWIVSRLGVYPFWIIGSITNDAPVIVAMFPAYYVFNVLLMLLLFLHLIWTYFILKIAFRSFQAGMMEGDIRSSSSEENLTEDGDSAGPSESQSVVGNGAIATVSALHIQKEHSHPEQDNDDEEQDDDDEDDNDEQDGDEDDEQDDEDDDDDEQDEEDEEQTEDDSEQDDENEETDDEQDDNDEQDDEEDDDDDEDDYLEEDDEQDSDEQKPRQNQEHLGYRSESSRVRTGGGVRSN